MTAIVAAEAQKRLAYKVYSTTTISPGALADITSDPTSTGGQVLRRVTSTFKPMLDQFSSQEQNTAQQTKDVRNGAQGVTVQIDGEISPGTWEDMMKAVLRCTPATIATKTEADFTSISFNANASTATLGSSTWLLLGVKSGDTFRTTNITGANLGVNFTVITVSGTSAVIFPAPADMTADTSATLTFPGKKLTQPDPPIPRKWLFEHTSSDNDVGELAEEVKMDSMHVVATEKVATIGFSGKGRGLVPISGGSNPFFTAPTVPTTSPVCTLFGGVVILNNTAVAAISKVEFTLTNNVNIVKGASETYPPQIISGKAKLTGSVDVYPVDTTFETAALNETECKLFFMVTADATSDADFVSFFMSRIKFGEFTKSGSGDGPIMISAPFEAYTEDRAGSFVSSTMLCIQDSLAS